MTAKEKRMNYSKYFSVKLVKYPKSINTIRRIELKNVLTLDYIVVIVYMLISLGVGFYFMKFNKNAADFFRGKNKIPWLVSGLSAFMTGFSAWTFTERQV